MQGENTMTLVLFVLTIMLMDWQNLNTALIERCKSTGVVANSAKSSAYPRSGTCLPLCIRGPTSGHSCKRWRCKPSLKRLNRVGLNGQPCFNPVSEGRLGLARPPILTATLQSAYMDLSASSMRPDTPRRRNTSHNRSLFTWSYAPFRSRKHTYNGLCASIKCCNMNNWCVVDKPGRKPACVSTRNWAASEYCTRRSLRILAYKRNMHSVTAMGL